MKLHSHKYPFVKVNLELRHIAMVKIRFQSGENSNFVDGVTCSVYVEHGTKHMLSWESILQHGLNLDNPLE